MLATASTYAQPPHLLSFPDMIRQPPFPQRKDRDHAHPAGPPSRPTQPPNSSKPLPTTTQAEASTARGIKGLFSRSRVTSPEPDPTIRSRLRSFIGENKAGPSRQTSSTAHSRRDETVARGTAQKGGELRISRGQNAIRPSSPQQTRRMNVRFGPSLLPAIQKGQDGKWQPPSLSRGSLSTSALALYAQDGDGANSSDISVEVTAKAREGKGTKHALSGLFHTRGRKDETKDAGVMKTVEATKSIALNPSGQGVVIATRSSRVTSGNGSGFSFQEISTLEPAEMDTPSRDRENTVRSPARKSLESPAEAQELVNSRLLASKRSPSAKGSSSPITSRPASSRAVCTPSSPLSRSFVATPQSIAPTLSRDHYHLRLATSYMIRILTPFVRGSGFAVNDKNAEMKRKADDHISNLARMEKGWGGDWVKAAGAIGKDDSGDNIGGGMNEDKVRSLSVSERAKQRERAVWVDVIRDGILLCLLLNQLFPASPQHITRVNITEDGIFRATNLTRFTTACSKVGVAEADVFGLSDVQEGSESGMGKVSWTVIALARLAGRSKAAVGSRYPLRAVSPAGTPARNRSPSKTAILSSTTADGSPQATAASPSSVNPGAISCINSSTQLATLERTHPAGTLIDLQDKLDIDTTEAKASTIDDPACLTPTGSTFLPTDDAASSSPRRGPLPRSTTQPSPSPKLRSISPTPSITSSPSCSSNPMARSLAASGRPTLRPRYTTGSQITVPIAPGLDIPLSPRSSASDRGNVPNAGYGGHSRERTPSLISSNSRVTSGYSRSSAAFSVATIIGDDHSNVVDIADDEADTSIALRMRERRMSGQTLQNARQKILGTLLSSEDLPLNLRQALEKEAVAQMDDSRDQAIHQSLAALEGWRSPTTRSEIDVSPRRPTSRPVSRCGDVMRVAEEDEVSSNGGSVIEGPKPSIVRRTSANGKVYVPKRSASPSKREAVSGLIGPAPFPASTSVGPAAPDSSGLDEPLQEYKDQLQRPITRVEKKQSDGISYAATGVEDKPMNPRSISMVNLGAVGKSPSIFRESLMKASQSQPLQILEINEAGFPGVKYQLGNCLGKGQFGSVFRSLNLSTGQMVAIKRIKLNGLKSEEVEDVMHEVELLQKLSHPGIVRYEGMSRDEEYLNIVLEYIENGSLVQTLKSFGRFNEQLISSYVAKILEGLDYLHSQGVVHCDLKAANILSTKNGNVKLSDFGVSLTMKAVENLQVDASRRRGEDRKSMESVQGSPNWMAPEVINLQGARTASDIWSLGCTIVELLTGQPPYSNLPNSMAVLWHIVMDIEPPIPAIDISDDLRDFLNLCFIKDPDARPAAVVLFEHPWIKKLNPDLAMRPQDSVPFLRRVSMDLRRIESTRLFSSDMAVPSSRAGSYADLAETKKKNRNSWASSHAREASDVRPKEHELIKTTFGKAILCRICHASVKKGGILCQHCGLICHTSCVIKASTRCDVTEQILLLARQQDYLTQHPHLVGVSAASSRRQSFVDDHDVDSGHFTALPVKILHGLKRNKSAMGSAVDLIGVRRRRSSSNLGRSSGASTSQGRQSLDAAMTRRDSNSQGRASVFTEASMTLSEMDEGDSRRSSAIRLALSDEPHGLQKQAKMEGEKVVSGVEVVTETIKHGRTGKGHKRDNKSDCVIM